MDVRRQLTLRDLVRLVLMLVVMVVGGGRSELVDIKPYYSLILERHNELRKTVSPAASDMRQIMWDDALARDAEDWAKYCRYERPPRHMYNCGSNLAYHRKYVKSWHSVRSNVLRGLQNWARGKEYFKYGTDCGMACSYVQMIYSSTYRVGCAMNTCSRLKVGDTMESYSTLFICFYAPRGRVTDTFPYRSGDTCTACPVGTKCSESLCAEGTGVVALYPLAPESLAQRPDRSEVTPAPSLPLPQPQPGHLMSSDKLTEDEVDLILQVHNMFRAEDACPLLQWDTGLKRWSDWVISCQADYPGPSHTYTNFYRCPDHMPIYEVVYGWTKEGKDTHIQLKKGCRTPYDHTTCNHYTNMMQRSVTAVACSACNCGDGTRQLVCIYDHHRNMRRG